jgi:uncharacterized UBP type Zn finger protein
VKTRPGICARKRRYAGEAQAIAAALAAPITLRPYRCAICRAYHLTSRTKGMKSLPQTP